eukprot:1412268-Prymnesium_polylepis.1
MSYRKYLLPGRPQRAGCWWGRSQFDGLASASSIEGARGGIGRRLPFQGADSPFRTDGSAGSPSTGLLYW